MKKIRTLIFHPALAPYRIDLFNELSQLLDLKVIFIRENLLNQKFDQVYLRKQLKCEYDFLLSGFDFRSRSFRWGVTRTISQYCPEVVICMEYSPITLCIAALKFFNMAGHWGMGVWTADNVAICNNCKTIRRLARKLILRITNSLIVYSEPVKKCYVELGRFPENTFVCRNIQKGSIVNLKLESSLPLVSAEITNSFLSEKLITLFVGRLVAIKGVDRLIRAFVKVSNMLPEAILMIVGDGPEKEQLKRLSLQMDISDKVFFLGQLEGQELYVNYLLADLFVLPSHHELYGAVVNEALLAGMPVICSSFAGSSELIREGFNGHIFNPFDVSRLSELMIEELQKVLPTRKGLEMRPSLMPVQFDESVQGFVQAVKYAQNFKTV